MAGKLDYLELISLQKEVIKSKEQQLIEREVFSSAQKYLESDNRILVISGMRRVGKSTLLLQLMRTT